MPLGGRTAVDGLIGIGERERAEFAAEKAGRVKGFEFLLFADVFQPLADVDERRQRRIFWPEHFRDPCRPSAARRPFAAAHSLCANDIDGASEGYGRGRAGHASGRASPRSITWAMFSRPADILMLSTGVSIAGNVLITFCTGRPTSNG